MLNYFRTSVATRVIISLIVGLQLNMLTIGAWGQQRDAITLSAPQGQSLAAEAMGYFSFDDAHMTLQDFFPDDRAGDTTSLESVYGRDTETIDLGSSAQSSLNLEASEEGEAYRTILQSSRRVSPDLSSDPLFNLADTVRDPAYLRDHPMFADCSKEDHFEEETNEAHMAAYRTCERLIKPTDNCQMNHELEIEAMPADIAFVIDKSSSMSGQAATMAANISGFMSLLSQQNNADIRFGAARSSGGGPAGDGNIQMTYNTEAVANWISTVYGGGGSNTLGTTRFVMDSFSWRPGVEKYILITGNKDGVDGTAAAALRDDLVRRGFKAFIFHDNGGVKILGEDMGNSFSAERFFNVAKTLAIVEDVWKPDACWDRGTDIHYEQFCEGDLTVTQATDDNGCAIFSGFNVCPGDPIYEQITEPPMPDVSKLATKIDIRNIECNYNIGQMDCWTDPQGTVHCPENEGGNENTCEQYEADPACGFISQSCVEGASGSGDFCYVYSEIWDCGSSLEYPTAVHTGTTYECGGGMRCMGTECFDASNNKSGDFAYAVTMLQVAQFAEHDLDCSGTCKVFPGEAMECKKALGGYIDCCEAPSGVSLFDYVNLTMEGLKMASAVHALSDKGSLFAPGYWEAAKGAASAVGKEVFTGQWGSILDGATAGWKEGMAGVGEGMISKFQGFMMEKAYDAMVSMGAEGAANAVFENAAGDAGMQLTSNAAAVVNVIGFIYTVYVIADMLVNIIWECEEEEFELGAKKETRQCVLVGTYCASKVLGSCVEVRESHCCYSSVVARIIQEQGKPQLGLNFGTAKEPSCEAMSVEELARIDWNQIDLTEWIGMLSMTDNLPTIDTVSLDHITGEGSGLGSVFSDEGEERLNTFDRNVKRLDDVDIDAAKKAAEAEAMSRIPR